MESCYDHRKTGSVNDQLCFDVDHTEGLEGWYCDEYYGSYEGEDYYVDFSFKDSFGGCEDGFSWEAHPLVPDIDKQKQTTYTEIVTVQVTLNNEEGDTKMTTIQGSRTMKTYLLVDEDPKLPVEKSLVYKFKNVMTEDSDETTIQQLLADNDINSIIAKHNEVRADTLNEQAYESTGSEIKLRPVKLKDLAWKVS